MSNNCQNENCFNFTSKHDLSGSWCQDECFIESESGKRMSRTQLLEMKVDYDWDMDLFERKEVQRLQIVKSQARADTYSTTFFK